MTERAVVDTDVVSFYLKRDSRFEHYRSAVEGRLLILSFMSLAELERWAIQAQWGVRRRLEMEEFLLRFVIAPFDRKMCRIWAEVMVGCRQKGRRIEVADAWVAATALYYEAPLITHNRNHYEKVEDLLLLS